MHFLTHSCTHTLTHSCTHTLTHSCTHTLTHALTHSLTHTHTYTLTHTHTHTQTHLLTHSHTLTHSLHPYHKSPFVSLSKNKHSFMEPQVLFPFILPVCGVWRRVVWQIPTWHHVPEDGAVRIDRHDDCCRPWPPYEVSLLTASLQLAALISPALYCSH